MAIKMKSCTESYPTSPGSKNNAFEVEDELFNEKVGGWAVGGGSWQLKM